MKYMYFITGRVYYKSTIPATTTHESKEHFSSCSFKELIEVEEKSKDAIYTALKNSLSPSRIGIGVYNHVVIESVIVL